MFCFSYFHSPTRPSPASSVSLVPEEAHRWPAADPCGFSFQPVAASAWTNELEVATGAAASNLIERAEKDLLLAFRDFTRDPDQVLRSWDRTTVRIAFKKEK